MDWQDQAVRQLCAAPCSGYQSSGSLAAEPTALASLALSAWDRPGPAGEAAAWLAARQSPDGAVGVCEPTSSPSWPTALAVLAWRVVDGRLELADQTAVFGEHIQRGIRHILSQASEPLPDSSDIGHNTRLIAWPWVAGTHAWVEPTALSVLALKACGYAAHPRTRDGVRLLMDRLLPTGGCNYGNTVVLGRTQRPHLQPTGLAVLALAGEEDPHRRLDRSLDFLATNTTSATASMSLAWSLLGLTAHGRRPPAASQWLQAAAERSRHAGWSSFSSPLLLLADRAETCGLMRRI